MSNFIVYALPRSRTAWLSHFLTYKDHTCKHEAAVDFRAPEDVKMFYNQSNTGSAETGGAQAWQLVEYYNPEIKTVIVRRDIKEVIDSLMDVDLEGVAYYPREPLVKHLEKSNKVLDKLERHSGVLSVSFNDLKRMETCQRVFEHCLPYSFDVKHWSNLKNQNIQMNVKKYIRKYHHIRPEMDVLKRLLKMELIHLRRSEPRLALWNKV